MGALPDPVFDFPAPGSAPYVLHADYPRVVRLTRDPFAPHRALVVVADTPWAIPRRRKVHVSVY